MKSAARILLSYHRNNYSTLSDETFPKFLHFVHNIVKNALIPVNHTILAALSKNNRIRTLDRNKN